MNFNSWSMGIYAPVVLFLLIALPAEAYQRTVLIEDFTNVNCTQCEDSKRDALLNSINVGDGVLSLRYHFNSAELGLTDDPVADADEAGDANAARRIAWYQNLIGFVSPLVVKVDGTLDVQAQEAEFATAMSARAAMESPVEIVLSEDHSEPDNVAVRVTLRSDVELNQHSLHLAVVAASISIPDLPQRLQNPDAPTELPNVMLKMLPDGDGTAVTMAAGGEQSLSFSYSPGEGELWSNAGTYIVAFVQDNGSGEILQAASTLPPPPAVSTTLTAANDAKVLVPPEGAAEVEITVANDNDDGLTVEYELSIDADPGNLHPNLRAHVEPQRLLVTAGGRMTARVRFTQQGTEYVAGRIQLRARPIAVNDQRPPVLPAAVRQGIAAMTEGTRIVVAGQFGNQPDTRRAYWQEGLLASTRYGDAAYLFAGTLYAWVLEEFAEAIDLAIIPLRYDDVTTDDVVQNFHLQGDLLRAANRLLDAGTSVLIFSQHSCSWALEPATQPDAVATAAFFRDRLGLRYAGPAISRLVINGQSGNLTLFRLNGVNGDPIGDGIAIDTANNFNQTSWPMYDAYTDRMAIADGSPSTPIFYADANPSNVVAVRAETAAAGARIVYYGFGMEALSKSSDRLMILDRSLDWLLDDGGGSTSVTPAQVGGQNGLALRVASHPVRTATEIHYRLPDGPPKQRRLSLHSILGGEVRVLWSGSRQGGAYSAMLQPDDLMPGVYFLVLQSESDLLSLPILLQR